MVMPSLVLIDGLSPVRRQAIIWTNADVFSIGSLGTTFRQNLIKIYTMIFFKENEFANVVCRMSVILSRPHWANSALYTRIWVSLWLMLCLRQSFGHYDDVIMDSIASQITSLTIVYSNVYSGADQSKHQSSASLAFVWGIHRWPVNSPHKLPVTRKIFPFDDVIMRHVTNYRAKSLLKADKALDILFAMCSKYVHLTISLE